MCESTMHRGRGDNGSSCNGRGVRAPVTKLLDVRQESRAHGWNKRENLNLSRNKGKNSVGSSDLAGGKHKGILIVRRQTPNEVSQEEARLDPGVADNVIAFLSTLQQVPKGLRTRGIQHILSKPDVQGRARAVLSSLHDECKMKLQRNDSARGTMKGEPGSSFSCRISGGPALSHSLEWPGRYKQIQNQVFAGVASHNPHLAANRINFPLQQVAVFGEPRLWGRRSDMQQRQPNSWWRRTLFGTLAGAASIRIMSLKYPWLLLSELFSLPCFRRNGHQNSKELVERRNWWHLPVKVATAISSRFCSSLSNPVVAANLLLLIFELRSMIDSERSADSGLTALKDPTQVGRSCCSCLASCTQDGTGVEHYNLPRSSKTFCVKSCGEFDQSLISSATLELEGGNHSYVQLPLNLREDITRMLVLARKGREVKDNSPCVKRKEDIVHLAELIHAALSMPKHSLGELLHAEPPALTPQLLEVKNSCAQVDSQVFISFVSNDFPEGIELVFPPHTPSNEDRRCTAAVTTDPHYQSSKIASTHFVEGHPQASENSALLKSILMEKCKSGVINSSKSSVYASDVESEYFFEACSMSLPDLEHSEYEQTQELDPSSENFESWRSTYSDASSVHGDDHSFKPETMAGQCSQNSFGFDCLGDQTVKIQSGGASLTLNRADTDLNVHPPLLPSTAECEEKIIPSVSTCAPLHFADHPTCISLRERRHEYGDQNYLTPDEFNTSRWRELVFWHGHCRQGNPTLCILLGRAVQQLPAGELQTISSVIISQMEYAELNLFKGTAKQMNIIMDLWGIGLMRMPPLEVLSRVGMIMNRDYAGRGGSIILVNAPVMLSLVIGAIKRVILRPAYNKGALIEKGFLEKKDRILFFNRNYKHALEKHFDLTMLPSMFGGKCNSKFCPQDCDLRGRGGEFWSETIKLLLAGKQGIWKSCSEFGYRLQCSGGFRGNITAFEDLERLFKIALLVDIAIGFIVHGVQLCIYTATTLSALSRVGYITIHGDGIHNSRLKQIFELSMRLGDSIVSATIDFMNIFQRPERPPPLVNTAGT